MSWRGKKADWSKGWAHSLGQAKRIPTLLDPEKGIVFLPDCICSFLEKEMSLLTSLGHKPFIHIIVSELL